MAEVTLAIVAVRKKATLSHRPDNYRYQFYLVFAILWLRILSPLINLIK
jgi:hypothetical protein